MRGNCYNAQGIVINPSVPLSGTTATISYSGLLAKSGATAVYAHVGYGESFEQPKDFTMTKTPTGFEVTIPVAHAHCLSVCFKDSANNWDNNNGHNYTFDVEV